MKDLTQSLSWDFYEKIATYESPLGEFACHFVIHKYDDIFFAKLVDRVEYEIFEVGEFDTLDDAKAACQQHYAAMVWKSLSPRAKVAVSIGMATLAQLDVTDEALAEIIKQNS
jgi:hypothetical protein